MLKALIISVLSLSFSLTTFAADKKLEKAAKKEAKEYAKEGWKVNPGALSLCEQLLTSREVQRELDENGFPKWIISDGKSIGSAYNAAKMQASIVARSEIASLIQTELASIIEQKMGNDEKGRGEAESIMQTIQASKGRIVQKLGRTRIIMECYRELPNGNVEVLQRIALPFYSAKDAVKAAVEEEAKESGKDQEQISQMSKRLDELMGW